MSSRKSKNNVSTLLPRKIIPFPNKDKAFHESWNERGSDPDLMNFPHPFRAIINGPPNMGKSTIVFNIIAHQQPAFERFIVIHCSPETKEYDILGPRRDDSNPNSPVEIRSDIPAPTSFDSKEKTLVIIDDVELKNLKKEQLSHLDRLFGFVSTHCNVSICLTCQNFFNLIPAIKRMANIFIIGKIRDSMAMKAISDRIGVKFDVFKEYLDILKDAHDTLWIDDTKMSPAPIRVNGYDIYEPADASTGESDDD